MGHPLPQTALLCQSLGGEHLKPEMPAHDYAVQWARDTLSGKAEGGRFQWGERNLARSYMRYRAELTEAKAEVARLREALKPFADAAAKAEPGGAPAFHFVGYDAWQAARRALEPRS